MTTCTTYIPHVNYGYNFLGKQNSWQLGLKTEIKEKCYFKIKSILEFGLGLI